jgi:hypothetical protein
MNGAEVAYSLLYEFPALLRERVGSIKTACPVCGRRSMVRDMAYFSRGGLELATCQEHKERGIELANLLALARKTGEPEEKTR